MGMGMPNGAFNTPYGMTNGVPEPYYNGDSWLYRSRANMFNQRMPQPPAQVSPLNDLLAKAMAAKANAPTMNQLFSGMSNQGMLGVNGAPINYGNPSYGAGRFLGANSIPLNMGSNTTT